MHIPSENVSRFLLFITLFNVTLSVVLLCSWITKNNFFNALGIWLWAIGMEIKLSCANVKSFHDFFGFFYFFYCILLINIYNRNVFTVFYCGAIQNTSPECHENHPKTRLS